MWYERCINMYFGYELNFKLEEVRKREKEMLRWQEKLTTTENH